MTKIRPLTTTEVAARLGCTKATVCNMIRDGRLSGFRLAENGHFRVWPDEVERHIREHRTEEVVRHFDDHQ